MRQKTIGSIFAAAMLAGCGGENDTADTGTTHGALTAGIQSFCQDCTPDAAVVKLRSTSSSFCSGVKISSTRVLTSARCLTDLAFTEAVSVTNRIDGTGFVAKTVKQTIVHPSFPGGVGVGFDAAVLEFTTALTGVGGTAMDPLPIDTGVPPDTGTDIAFGNCNPHSGFSGTKQVADMTVSVSATFPNYLVAATGATRPGFCSQALGGGDFGGVLINGFNSVAGINSFLQNGSSFVTRTQPIRTWIQAPTRITAPVGFKNVISQITGKCLQANSNLTVTESFCNGQTNQQWSVTAGGLGQQLRSRTGLGCAALGGSTSVRLSGCGATQAETWSIGSTSPLELVNAGAVGPNRLYPVNTNTLGFVSNTDSRRFWYMQ